MEERTIGKVEMSKIVTIDDFGITLVLDENGGGGSIEAELKEVCPYCNHADCYFDCDGSQYHEDGDENCLETEEETNQRRDYNSAIDGIESLILAHAVAGVAVTSHEYIQGIQAALDGCANNI